MNDPRSPLLEEAFAQAERNLEDEAFVNSVMARARALDRKRSVLFVAVGLAAIFAIWLIGTSLNEALSWLPRLVSRPLTALGGGWAAPILAPLNSLASLLVLGLLALRAVYRWLFA